MSVRAMTQRTRRIREGGFSAVELALVVGIMLILAAISFPALLNSIRNYEIRGGATEVAAEIQHARTAAVMRNVRYGVVLVVRSSKEYQFVVEDTLDPAEKAVNLYVTADTTKRIQLGPRRQLPGRVEFATDCPDFAPNNTSLRFTRLGTMCEPAGLASPRLPGTCPAVATAGDVRFVEFAGGVATLCLGDPRGLRRTVVVSPGGRVQIVTPAVGS